MGEIIATKRKREGIVGFLEIGSLKIGFINVGSTELGSTQINVNKQRAVLLLLNLFLQES